MLRKTSRQLGLSQRRITDFKSRTMNMWILQMRSQTSLLPAFLPNVTLHPRLLEAAEDVLQSKQTAASITSHPRPQSPPQITDCLSKILIPLLMRFRHYHLVVAPCRYGVPRTQHSSILSFIERWKRSSGHSWPQLLE